MRYLTKTYELQYVLDRWTSSIIAGTIISILHLQDYKRTRLLIVNVSRRGMKAGGGGGSLIKLLKQDAQLLGKGHLSGPDALALLVSPSKPGLSLCGILPASIMQHFNLFKTALLGGWRCTAGS